MATISNSRNDTVITGTNEKDIIYNGMDTVGDRVKIFALGGNDVIENFGNSVTIDGGTGNDYINNNWSDSVTIDGGAGDDSIWNSGNNVSIYGGTGDDSIFNDKFCDQVTINGGAGNDTIDKASGICSTIDGGEGDDLISNDYYGYSSTIMGGAGADTIRNFGDSSSINGGDGNDYIENGYYSKIGGSEVTINGGDGDDTLKGENGNDTIYGGTGNDKIDGGKGSDWIFGGKGNDCLKGGNEVDVFVYTLGDGNDTIVDYTNTDIIQLVDADIYKTQVIGSNVIFTFDEEGTLTVKNGKGKKFNLTDEYGVMTSTVIKSSSSNDPTLLLLDNSHKSPVTIDLAVRTVDASTRTKAMKITGNDFDNVLIGGTGKDTLNGSMGDDILTGGKGNDVFIYDSGDDTITDYATGDKISVNSSMKNFSTDDDDVIIDYKNGSLTIENAVGKKITFIENGKTYVNAYSTDGILNGAGTAITLSASTTTFTAGSKLVSIDASTVENSLEIAGNSKDNKIFANKYGTTLNGGAGNDMLWGGNGADTFIYDDGGGRDTIIGFDNSDILQIGDFIASVKDNKISFQVGSQKNAVTLKDFTATAFNINGDFYRIQGNKLVK